MTTVATPLSGRPTIDFPVDEHSDDLALFHALADAQGAERDHIQTILVRRYARLVRAIASHYASSGGDVEELRAVGYVGLVLAIQRFDSERGHEFAAFARPTITGEIRRYFRDKRRWVRLPRRIQETKAQLVGATETLTHRLGRSPTVPELAGYMQVDPELIIEAISTDDAFVARSLDAPMGADDQDAWTLGDTIGGEDERFNLSLDLQTLGPLVARLSARDREILHLRFVEDLTQREIGQRLGYSQMHISRILGQTFDELRAGLIAS